jgi:ssDNA-binding replication factor A large subunit
MLKFSYEEIVRRIEEKTGLPKEEIEEKVSKKVSQLSDLVSKEGAAHIVANQLGIKLFENLNERKIKINEIAKGSSFVNILGRVTAIYGINKFNRNGKESMVASLMVADESGSVRVAIWDETLISIIDKNEVKEGDIVKLVNGYSRDNNGRVELHLGNRSKLEVNPEGETVGEVNLAVPEGGYSIERKKIIELEDGNSAELFGTVVQIFEPKFYDSCPKCKRKPALDDNKFLCKEHGTVEAKKSPILNLFLDDGFGNIRVVCFNDQVEEVLGKKDITEENIGNIEEIMELVLGKQYLIKGRTVKNQFFGRLEFIARSIFEADPVKLIEESK